jgi:hypothetical protein
MKDKDLKYINLIIKEIVAYIDNFPTLKFKSDRSKFIYVANILTKINLFLALLQFSKYDDQFVAEISQIMNFNLTRLVELTGYSEEELDEKMKEAVNQIP